MRNSKGTTTTQLVLAWGFVGIPLALGRAADAHQRDAAVQVDANATRAPLPSCAGKRRPNYLRRTEDGTQLRLRLVRETPRSAIYAIRVQSDLLEPDEVDQLAARMRERIAARGEVATDVVVVQGDSRETLALFGEPYSVRRVRTAMFNAAISWKPIELD